VVLAALLVTVAIRLWLFWHVEMTSVPSAVPLKCCVIQLAHREVVELGSDMLSDTDPSSAMKLSPTLYPQAAIGLSASGMRTPPKTEQQADTAASLLPQHPGESLGMDEVAVALAVALLIVLP